jgi:hypothetical protein
MKIIRRLLLIALIITIALPIAYVAFGVLWYHIAPTYYAHKWSNDFSKIKTIHDAEEYSQGNRDLFVYKFENDEWMIARCETSCCSGAGYNISIIHDSRGETYMNTEYSFCGREISEIISRFRDKNSRPPKSLDDFYKNTAIPLTKR